MVLIEVMKQRWRKWVGQDMSGDGFLKKVIRRRFQGKRKRGGKRQKMLGGLRSVMSCEEAKEKAQNWEY